MKKTLKMLASLAAATVFLGAVALTGAYWLGGTHKQRVTAFWAERDRPDGSAAAAEAAFPLSLLIPSGGPLIANGAVGCGGGAAQLPVVPLRHVDGDAIEVLCGIGDDAYVRRLAVADIRDAEIRAALRGGRGAAPSDDGRRVGAGSK